MARTVDRQWRSIRLDRSVYLQPGNLSDPNAARGWGFIISYDATHPDEGPSWTCRAIDLTALHHQMTTDQFRQTMIGAPERTDAEFFEWFDNNAETIWYGLRTKRNAIAIALEWEAEQ